MKKGNYKKRMGLASVENWPKPRNEPDRLAWYFCPLLYSRTNLRKWANEIREG